MAADGVPGAKGNPQFLGGGAPATAVDFNLVSQWAADRVGEGVATAGVNGASLPTTNNWVGRVVTAIDTGIQWLCVATPGTWKPLNNFQRQLDTTNSATPSVITQFGTGKVVGNNTIQVLKAVVFPVAFASLPILTVTSVGYRTAGAFDPSGLLGSVNGAAAAGKSLTGFNAIQNLSGATFASSLDYYFDWVAIGVPA